LADYIIVSYDS